MLLRLLLLCATATMWFGTVVYVEPALLHVAATHDASGWLCRHNQKHNSCNATPHWSMETNANDAHNAYMCLLWLPRLQVFPVWGKPSNDWSKQYKWSSWVCVCFTSRCVTGHRKLTNVNINEFKWMFLFLLEYNSMSIPKFSIVKGHWQKKTCTQLHSSHRAVVNINKKNPGADYMNSFDPSFVDYWWLSINLNCTWSFTNRGPQAEYLLGAPKS